MQSRQCLLRNIPNKTGAICQKTATDLECIRNCSKSATIFGSQKEGLVVKKRKGFYSAIYPYNKKTFTPDFPKILENLPSSLENAKVRQVFYISEISED
jgi:hypothetical protein